MNVNRTLDRQFRIWTPGIVGMCDLVAGFNATLEVEVHTPTLPPELAGMSAKQPVDSIIRPKGREGMYSLRLKETGRVCRFQGKEGYVKVGGGAANAVATIRQLEHGIARHKQIRTGIIAGVGQGEKAAMILEDLKPILPVRDEPPWFIPDSPSVELGLLPAQGTNITLSLKVKGGPSFLLWQQEQYLEEADPYPALSLGTPPKAALFMSVKPNEVRYVDRLLRVYSRKGQTVCGFSPNSTILVDEGLNAFARQLAERSHVSSMNHREAIQFLGRSNPFAGQVFEMDREDHRVKLAQATSLYAAPVSIVTFEHKGVIVCSHGEVVGTLPSWKPRDARDVVGCGDAFFATTLAFYALKYGRKTPLRVRPDLDHALRAVERGVIAAGFKSTRRGPSSGIPTWLEIENVIKKIKGR